MPLGDPVKKVELNIKYRTEQGQELYKTIANILFFKVEALTMAFSLYSDEAMRSVARHKNVDRVYIESIPTFYANIPNEYITDKFDFHLLDGNVVVSFKGTNRRLGSIIDKKFEINIENLNKQLTELIAVVLMNPENYPDKIIHRDKDNREEVTIDITRPTQIVVALLPKKQILDFYTNFENDALALMGYCPQLITLEDIGYDHILQIKHMPNGETWRQSTLIAIPNLRDKYKVVNQCQQY